jgi:hypothetical protein
MKIVILSVNDWANLGYTFSKCLNEVGLDALALTQCKISKYKDSAEMANTKFMKKKALEADVIIFMHSKHINLGMDFNNKKVFVFHGGSKYRHNSDKINKIFNPIVDKTIIQTSDLLGLGAKDERWMLPPVDTKKLIPNYHRLISNKLIIGHFPSSRVEKGTDIINEVANDLLIKSHNLMYLYDDSKVSWEENLKRIALCDIYIEQIRWGEWGVTALEAAALGKIVITNFKSLNRYRQQYGDCQLMVANNKVELRDTIKNLLTWNDNYIDEKKKLTRKWVKDNHSYKSIGNRLKQILMEE